MNPTQDSKNKCFRHLTDDDPSSTSKELLELLSVLTQTDTEEALLQDMAHRVQCFTKTNACDVFLANKEKSLVLQASSTMPDFIGRLIFGKGVGLVSYVVQTGRPLVIPDNLNSHSNYVSYPGIKELSTVSAVIMPIHYQEGCIGALFLKKSTPWQPTSNELEKIDFFAKAIAIILKGFERTYSIGAKSSQHLGALTEVSKLISQSPYLEEILQLLVNITAEQFNYKVCTVRLLDRQEKHLVLRATQSPVKAYQQKRAIKLGESIAGRAIEENRPIIVRDVQKEADYIGHELAAEQNLRSMICVPLTIMDKPVGVLTCYTSELHIFNHDEVDALETIAKQAAFSIEHAKLQVRNTLMQEMHHRVKNNLQQIVSLLRLQLRHSKYTSIEHALNDSLSRILAIAAVHDLLSREDLDHIGVKTLAESLVNALQQSLILPEKNIRFEVRGDDVHLNVSQSTQVALIINELLQNAVEHGFKIANHGEIHITIEEKNGDVMLWVSENGDSLPENFDPKAEGQLGMQIVDSLTKAMGGSFILKEVLGWVVAEVHFPRATSE